MGGVVRCVCISHSGDVQILLPYVPFIINFIKMIAEDDDRSEDNIAACAGLIG